MQQKVGAEKGCTKERQQILFIFDSVKTGRHDKGRFVQPSIGQGLAKPFPAAHYLCNGK